MNIFSTSDTMSTQVTINWEKKKEEEEEEEEERRKKKKKINQWPKKTIM
jgi:hypothetical protein